MSKIILVKIGKIAISLFITILICGFVGTIFVLQSPYWIFSFTLLIFLLVYGSIIHHSIFGVFKRMKRRTLFIVLIFLVLSFFIGIFLSLYEENVLSKKGPDARIISAISQARTIMVYIYVNKGNYDNFNCQLEDMRLLCQEIKNNYKGKEEVPIIVHNPSVNSSEACIYSPMSWGGWYCANSSGIAGYTDIDPGGAGYCVDGESAVCPPKENLPAGNQDTFDWQTYRNEEYGFEVKYPKGWKGCETRQYPPTEEYAGKKGLLRITPSSKTYACLYGSLGFEILIGSFSDLDGVKDYYSKLFEQGGEERCDPAQLIEFTTFHNSSALKIGSCDSSGEYEGESIVFFHNNNLFEISYAQSIMTDYENILDKILSTFRFLK